MGLSEHVLPRGQDGDSDYASGGDSDYASGGDSDYASGGDSDKPSDTLPERLAGPALPHPTHPGGLEPERQR